MTAFALALILLAPALHMTWNLAAQRAANGLPLVWASVVRSLVLWPPLAWITWWRYPQTLTSTGFWFIGLSGELNGGYALFLQRADRTGDFSLLCTTTRHRTVALIARRHRRRRGHGRVHRHLERRRRTGCDHRRTAPSHPRLGRQPRAHRPTHAPLLTPLALRR